MAQDCCSGSRVCDYDHNNSSEQASFDAQKVPQPSFDPYFTCNKKIITDLLIDEVRYRSPPGFCNEEGPSELNFWMRGTLISWLRDVCEHKKCETEVLALAVQLVDRCLNILCVLKQDYQLVGATCFLMASKIKETIPISVDRMVQYTDYSVTKQDLLLKEIVICDSLDYDLSGVTSIDFFQPTLDLLTLPRPIQQTIRHTAIDIFIKCIHAVKLCDFQPSCVAGACILAAIESAYPSDNILLIQTISRIKPILGTDSKLLMQCYDTLHGCLVSSNSKNDPSEGDNDGDPLTSKTETRSKQTTPTDLRDVRF